MLTCISNVANPCKLRAIVKQLLRKPRIVLLLRVSSPGCWSCGVHGRFVAARTVSDENEPRRPEL
jgi:hypothetical protein